MGSRRHSIRPGDPVSLIRRLDERVRAGSGADPFTELLKLLVAQLVDVRWHNGARLETGAAAVDALLAEAATRWPGVVPEPVQTQLSGGTLAACTALLATAPLGDGVEVLDSLFEGLISRTAKGEKGQFFTPRHVAEAAARILAPQPGQRLLDPACGSGGMLMAALRAAPQLVVAGQDFDPRAVQVSRVLMAACGQRPAVITQADSLQPDPSLDGTVDLILTNPPFAGDIAEPALLARYALARPGRRVERDALFIERCVTLLRPGGRLAMVLPHSKLGGRSWAYLRQWLLQRVRVVGVIGLPRETFLPHTSQKTAILLGVRRHALCPVLADERVRMAISEKIGKDSRGRPVFADPSSPAGPAWSTLDHDLGEVVDAMQGVW